MTNATATATRNPAAAIPEVSAADANLRVQIVVSMPLAMKVLLERTAESRKTTVLQMAREAIAASVGFDLPKAETRVAKSGLSDVEKKAAQAAKNKERRDLIKAALEQYRKPADAAATPAA